MHVLIHEISVNWSFYFAFKVNVSDNKSDITRKVRNVNIRKQVDANMYYYRYLFFQNRVLELRFHIKSKKLCYFKARSVNADQL